MIFLRLTTIMMSLVLLAPAIAHDSHTHTAPWKACSAKKKEDLCAYKNGQDDLFKGSCQSFHQQLMCVRNQPIIYAKAFEKKEVTSKKTSSKD